MAIQPFLHTGPMDNGVYLIFDRDTGDAAIVDPGLESEFIWDVIQASGLTLKYVLNTHGHTDHIFNNTHFLQRSDALLLIHEADVFLLDRLVESARRWGMELTEAPKPDGYLSDGQIITLGQDTTVEVRHTPGHTPGSMSFVIAGAVVAGDTLFAGSIGRFDGPGGSGIQLIQAVREKLFVLPDETVVYPGHGEATTIGREKRYNPFFQAGAERYITH